jgi:hypothetical protein
MHIHIHGFMNVIDDRVVLHSDRATICVRKVPDLNSSQDIDCPDWNLSLFSSFPSNQLSGESKIFHRQFPAESFHFIVHPVI